MVALAVSDSNETARCKQVGKLLRGYERFRLFNEASIYGWCMELRTEVMIHRKHTKRGLFIPNSFYTMATMTDLPSLDYIKAWLEKARESTEIGLNKGEYTGEELIGGEWQSVKRHYNQWIYYDYTNHATIGKVRTTQPTL